MRHWPVADVLTKLAAMAMVLAIATAPALVLVVVWLIGHLR